MQTIDISKMYWETYDDQATSDFEYIGIEGSTDVEPVTDIDTQVRELRRLHGKRVSICVYRKDEKCTI